MNTRDGRTDHPKHRSTGVTATGRTCRPAVGWSVPTMDGTGAPHLLRDP